MTTKTVAEQFAEPDGAGSVAGSSVLPDPVNTGDAHANRPQDNPQGEQGTVQVRGQTISRAAMVSALMSMLAGMDTPAIEKMVNAYDLSVDANQNPSSATAGAQAGNLASISVKEDVAELFAGEELTEEFKGKATLIFEAAVNARVEARTAEIEEKAAKQIDESVSQITEQFTQMLDKYVTYAAEEYIENNKATLEQTVRSTLAEEFLDGVIDLARRYNVEIPQDQVDLIGKLEEETQELKTKLNESLDAQIALKDKLKTFERKEAFDAVSESLTVTQRERLRQLAEGVEYKDIEDYKTKVTVLAESVVSATAAAPAKQPELVTEAVVDGVPPLVDPAVTPVRSKAIEATLAALGRVNRS